MIRTFIFYSSILLILLSCEDTKKELPFLGKHEIVGKDTVFHSIPKFSFLNQNSHTVSQELFKGKIHVANFFFTSCPSICPLMTKQLIRVQKLTRELSNFRIISFTVDSKRDTPERLTKYVNKMNVDTSNWDLLTGDQSIIYDLGMNGYNLSAVENDSSPGGFIHSPNFILVDQNLNIRGVYEGTNAAEVKKMVDDIMLLASD